MITLDDAVTLERLGQDEMGRPIWVGWCPAPLADALTALSQAGLDCPGCGRRWPLGRPGGAWQAVQRTPNCGSVSDSCPCGVILHLDATAPEQRNGLGWVRVARGGPLSARPEAMALGLRLARQRARGGLS